jgi:hypothetical protein
MTQSGRWPPANNTRKSHIAVRHAVCRCTCRSCISLVACRPSTQVPWEMFLTTGDAHLQRSLIFATLSLSLASFASTPLLADVACGAGQAAKCHTCSGTIDCKALEMSGTCNGPVTCGKPGDPCGCVAKLKAINTNSLGQSKPLSKSQ